MLHSPPALVYYEDMNTTTITKNDFHLWMQGSDWAMLTRGAVEQAAAFVVLSIGERVELTAHMDSVYGIFEDEASAAMAGCMFVLGATGRDLDDSWS